jgi:murein L,D-transpeptidase YafK
VGGFAVPTLWSGVKGGAVGSLALIALLIVATPAKAVEELKADHLIVLKSKRLLELLYEGRVVKTYRIDLGRHPVGPKTHRGDNRTPEGIYVIDGRHATTPYHLALHVSYPNDADLARARAARLDPGGSIFIHGLPVGYDWADPVRYAKDWTEGCIAVGNGAIEEIWRATQDGTVIEIRP